MWISAPTYIAVLFAILGMQLWIWLIARHSTYIEMWRVLPVAAAGVVCGNLVLYCQSELGLTQVVGFSLAGAFAAWILIGWLYDMEIKHRLAVAFSLPVIGTLAMLGGNALNNEFLRQADAYPIP